MDIVVIDDDPDTQDILSLYLKSEGFHLFPALTGLEGLQLVKQHDPDLVILDVLLPQMDGWETCKNLRSFSSVPILMISAAHKDDEDVVRGLNAGADDYISKPIKPSLLKARVNALLRRSNHVEPTPGRSVYIDTHLRVDTHRQQVFVQGNRLSLSSLEYRLLEILVVNAPTAIPMVEIVEELWSEEVDNSYAQYVRIYIGRLRKHIEPNPQKPRYIITETWLWLPLFAAGMILSLTTILTVLL